jgi:hypothetical protein
MNFEQKDEIPYDYPFKFASHTLIVRVWLKGEIIPGYKPTEWRKDRCGTIMHFSRHGDTNSSYGWEIDHIIPQSIGGTDDLSNLQPLQWQNNRKKGNLAIWNCD